MRLNYRHQHRSAYKRAPNGDAIRFDQVCCARYARVEIVSRVG